MTRLRFARRNISMSTPPKKNDVTRLIVAASESEPDMLYATRFFAPDAFIFLEERGKRTLVLSPLPIDRARKTAQADEFVSYRALEIERATKTGCQGEFVSYRALEKELTWNQRKAPACERLVASFLANVCL